MAKYSKDLTVMMCELIEDGEMTIADICKSFQLTRKTFYEWRKGKKEFREAIAEAVRCRNEKLFCIARETVRRKLNGYKTVTTKTTYVPLKGNPEVMVVQSRVVTEKEHAPDASMLNLIMKEAYRETEKEVAEVPQHRPMIIEVLDQKTKENMEMLQRGERRTPTPEMQAEWQREIQEYNKMCGMK